MKPNITLWTNGEQWWDGSLAEIGVTTLDRTLSSDANWEEVLQSGRDELQFAMQYSQMKTGRTRRVLDVGCGVGRVCFALVEHFGEVVGVDISAAMLTEARAHNTSTNIRFKLMSPTSIEPGASCLYDTIFADEVFHYLDWPALISYCEDAHRLLREGGEFVFQLNMEPVSSLTHLSWRFRKLLHWCGVKQWQGWSNHPDLMRRYYPIDDVRAMLQRVGFPFIRVKVGSSLRQTWFVARLAS